MKIKCGKCSTYGNNVYHASVEEVRQCHLDNPQAGVRPTAPPSSQSSGYTGARVDLRALEDKVPEGRYAVEMPDERLHFFVVDKPDTGKWKGYTFVKEQAGDELHGVRAPKRRELVLATIGADPGEAMLRYGLELGKCGHCGRTLTNEESRALGIGPVCRGKMPSGFFRSEPMGYDESTHG